MDNEKFFMLDTETTNSLDDPLCYDIGGIVFDESGKVFDEVSYVVADIFTDKELMDFAFYKEKIPLYWQDIKDGKRNLHKFPTIYHKLNKILREYDIQKIVAHNLCFDYRSVHLTQRFLSCSKYRFFFPYKVEFWDTLKMAREVLGKDEQYRKFCQENKYLTQNGKNRYTAEVVYRFITGDNSFIESHTGLEDAKIEKDIFLYCLKRKPQINGNLWA